MDLLAVQHVRETLLLPQLGNSLRHHSSPLSAWVKAATAHSSRLSDSAEAAYLWVQHFPLASAAGNASYPQLLGEWISSWIQQLPLKVPGDPSQASSHLCSSGRPLIWHVRAG